MFLKIWELIHIKSGGEGSDGYVRTELLGSFPNETSSYGELDIPGNVWEWVTDWIDVDYYGGTPAGDPLRACAESRGAAHITSSVGVSVPPTGTGSTRLFTSTTSSFVAPARLEQAFIYRRLDVREMDER